MEHQEVSDPIYYSPEQGAKVAQVSRAKVLSEIRDGKLRAGRVGVQIRISRQALIEWIEGTSAQAPVASRDPRRNGKRKAAK